MSKKIIIANWKMNPQTEIEAVSLAKALDQKGAIIAAPFVFLPAVAKKIKKSRLVAQDVFWEREGSYTGEISPAMLKDFRVKYAIVGHSERRALGETDEMVGKKVRACLKENLIPILCVGERVRDHEMFYFSAVKNQLAENLQYVKKSDLKKIIIAYEPVWAIGQKAKRETTPAECLEMVIFIKKVLADKYGAASSAGVRIIYGGSVNPKNAGEFLASGGVDGLLVGRDSLDPKKFHAICQTAQKY